MIRPPSGLSRAGLSLVVVALAGSVPARAEPPRPVIAVFDLEDQTKKLKKSDVRELTAYLSGRIASAGTYKIVPEGALRQALGAAKAKSYAACVDTACQIEIGREVAAEKTLHTRIVALGTQCAVTGTVFDLRTAASDGAATEKSACRVDALVTALEKVADQLGRSVPSAKTEVAKPGVHGADGNAGGVPVAEKAKGEVLVELFADGSSPLPPVSKGQFGNMECHSSAKKIECRTSLPSDGRGLFDMTPTLGSAADNFEIEAVLRPLDPSQPANYALMIGRKAVEGGAGYRVLAFGFDVRPPTPQAYVNYCDGRGWSDLAPGRPAPELIQASEPVKIRAEVSGRRVRLFYNDKRYQVFDSPIPLDGGVGFSIGGTGAIVLERLVLRDLPR